MACAVVATGLLVGSVSLRADDPKLAPAGGYAQDFSKVEVGKAPEDVLVLNGTFAVKEEAGNRFLELPGAPLDTFGLLFGPDAQKAQDVRARVYGTSDGKLFPEFGIGTNDATGYKLWVIPGQPGVELRKGEGEVVARAPYAGWKSGAWTALRLRVAPAAGGKWTIEGKAWPAGEKEPEAWTVTFTDTAEPAAGRASIWGQPYSDTPIRFDDLSAVAP